MSSSGRFQEDWKSGALHYTSVSGVGFAVCIAMPETDGVQAPSACHATGNGFDFLGWNFRKYRGTLLIKPNRKNAQALYDKVKEVVRSHLPKTQGELLMRLNPILRGWAKYHQPVVAKNLAFQKQLVSLYMSQSGRCALRGEPLDPMTGWHDHHIVRKVDGGSDLLSNRALLHPVRHTRLYVLGLTVAKPVPQGA